MALFLRIVPAMLPLHIEAAWCNHTILCQQSNTKRQCTNTSMGFVSMAEHKFKIGERVYFHSRSRREVPPGPCQIIKRLPAANGEFQYLIRSEYKDHQHVAKESELSRY